MESTREMIMLLKQVRTEKQLSYDQIIALLEQNNQFLSKSTLSRVFADGSEDGNFRYETLRPICEVLLDIEHIEKDDNPDVQAMKRLLHLKRDIIEEMKSELQTSSDEMEREINKERLKYHEKLEKETEKFQRSLDFMNHQIELKDQRIDILMSMNTELMQTNNKLLNQIMNCPLKNQETAKEERIDHED